MEAISGPTRCQLTGTNVIPALAHASDITNHSLRFPLTIEIVSPSPIPAPRNACTVLLTAESSSAHVISRWSSTSADCSDAKPFVSSAIGSPWLWCR